MTTFWAKIEVDHKITRDLIYKCDFDWTVDSLYFVLREICEKLDIPCPGVIDAHFKNLKSFRHAKFLPRDFVENVYFDCLILEDVILKH